MANKPTRTKKPKAVKKLQQLKDFRAFADYVMRYALNIPQGTSDFQADICDYLQDLPKGKDGIGRGSIQAHRGAGKSYLTAIYAVWHGYWNPDAKILVASSTQQRAMEFISLSKQIINTCDLLKHMAPRLGSEGSPTGKDQTDNSQSMDFGSLTKPAKDPSLVAYGISATMTGAHPDIIIADDIETIENGVTASGREKLIAKVREFESLIQPKGTIVILGTPQSQESIYMQLREQYPIRRWPAEFPDPNDEQACAFVSPWIITKCTEDPTCIGRSAHPERFDDVELEVKKEQYGLTTYTLQMLINTALADAERYPLRLRDLAVMDCDPFQTYARVVWGNTKNAALKMQHPGLEGDALYAPAFVSRDDEQYQYDRKVMFIDPSGRGDDETAYCIAASFGGMIYLLETGGFQEGNHPITLQKLARVAAKYDVPEIFIEANFGDGMFSDLMYPVVAEIKGATDIKEYKVTTKKESRILNTMEPVMFNHRLVIDTKVAKDSVFLHQLTHITHAAGSLKHDDRIDCVAAAVSELQEALLRNLDDVAHEARREAFEQRVDEWESYFRTSNGVGIAMYEEQHGRAPRVQRGGGKRQRKAWGNAGRKRSW